MKPSRKHLVVAGSAGLVAALTLTGFLAVRGERVAEPSEVQDSVAQGSAASALNVNSRRFEVPAPYIPPQCYTKTKGEQDETASNPCYVCHNVPERPNFIEDGDLQVEYTFPELARKNPWTNLFVDRREALSKVSDDEILEYVRVSNLFDGEGKNVLAAALQNLPSEWDANGNGVWNGYVPDAHFNFDKQGYDKDAEGKPTGWRAFAYYPFQGTFWPTNGSAGDVLIRLPEVFRQDESGTFDREVYSLNFAILESLIKKENVPTEPVDEAKYQVDLNRNGKLDTATEVVFSWEPLKGKKMSYVGKARIELGDDSTKVAAGLFPQGTELLHTVRYLDVQDGKVVMADRLKELRYAKKVTYRTYSQLASIAYEEVKEKEERPDGLRQLVGDTERGLFNGQGWAFSGFIEDDSGSLRPQTREETAFCMGCHGGVSQTSDSIFSFARKLPSTAQQQGWYHWSQSGLEGLPEPKRKDGTYAYTQYLTHARAGDEFRGNKEVIEKFFDASGKLKADMAQELHEDISVLLLPSPGRALALNKAYREVVREQSFIRGRDAVISPAENVHREVDEGQPTGVTEFVRSDRFVPEAAQTRL